MAAFGGLGRFIPGLSMMGEQQPSQGVPSVMGFPAVPSIPTQAPRKGRDWRGALDIIGSGLREAAGESGQLDAARKRKSDAEKLALVAQRQQEMAAFAATLPPQERQVYMADPEAWAKSRAKGYEPQVVAQGSSVFTGDGGFQQAPLGPQRLGPGDTLYDPQTRQPMITTPFKPEIVTTSPGQTATEVRPGGMALSPRSPEVGQYIKGQLEGIPGLVLGSAAPRSEAEIASLPLSAPDTYHRQGAALDFTAPGADPQQVIAGVRAKMGPGYDVIYHRENNSYHVEPGPNWSPPGGSSRVVAQGAPTGFRPATAEDRQRWGIPDGVPVKINVLTGEPEAISGMSGALPKPPPAQVVSGFGANQAAMKKVQTALDLLNANPQAVGIPRMFGDTINQRMDPNGVEARQAIMDIAGQIMSDRSGASVPAAEMVRLEPYLPQVTDSVDTVKKKLGGLLRELESTNQQMQYDFPSLGQPGAGQRGSVTPSPAPRTAPPPRKPAAGQGRAAPPAPRSADPLAGIAQGQIIVQGGKRYQRRGNQMVEVR